MTKKKLKPDLILLMTIFLLIFLGFLILAGVSMSISQKLTGNSFYFLLHQLAFGFGPGILLAFAAYKIPLKFVKKLALPLIILAIILMLFVFLPQFSTSLGGAKRWISVANFSFQPAEFLKLAFIIYLAAWLSKHKKAKHSFSKFFLPMLIILAIVCALLIAQPDISTLVIIALVALIMYFIADTPLYQTTILITAGLAGLVLLIKMAPYRFNRLLVFLRPDTQPLGIGFQIKQALIAVGSGGILGQGIGLSAQKFSFLPAPMTDTIFAVFAEETGFVGAVILVLLFLIFGWQGFRLAKTAENDFLKLLTVGIVVWLIAQTFVNIGAIIGILPLTGIPLPFVSYGSSHLLVEFVAVGLLLNISKQIKS